MYFILLLFGAVFTESIPEIIRECKHNTFPTNGVCEITWKTHNEKQALATCLEYFPTTFVTLTKRTDDKVICTVKKAYQCVTGQGTYQMFDKCYSFVEKNADGYVESTIAESKNYCKNGKLAVFYSYTQAKFVGMKANELGIGKLWIGIHRNGKEIEGDRMLHSNLWKLKKDDYWDGDELKKCTTKIENNEVKYICPDVKYIFMRTRTDYVYNRMQGYFEQATAKTKAFVACEFEAKNTADQRWYCDKLIMLTLDAYYDEKTKRCLYVSSNAYPMKVEKDDRKYKIATIKGCQERPTTLLHSAGIDDGTASVDAYSKFTRYKENTLRLSAYLNEHVVKSQGFFSKEPFTQPKCDVDGNNNIKTLSAANKQETSMRWRHVNHHGKEQYYWASSIPWDANYPKNECSDFPGKSNTLGVRNGKFVDVPPEVRLHAICSIAFFQECENTNNPCDGDWMTCTNEESYQEKIYKSSTKGGFYKCDCPEKHHFDESTKECIWEGEEGHCAWTAFHLTTKKTDERSTFVPTKGDPDESTRTAQRTDFLKSRGTPNMGKVCEGWKELCNDKLFKIVIRRGCRASIYAHHYNSRDDVKDLHLLSDLDYGTHQVPNAVDKTLNGQWEGMGASSMWCQCGL